MPAWAWGAAGIALVLAGFNVATTRRLWASQIFERPQKIAQTAFLWLVPMSFLVIRHVLFEPGVGRTLDSTDPTLSGAPEWDFGSAAIGGHHHHFGEGSSGGGEGGGGGDGSGGGGD